MKVRFLQFRKAMSAALFVLLLSVAGVTKALAQTFTVGDLNYSINDDGVSVTVTGHVDGTSATGSLTIPEAVSYEGTDYSVTEIGGNAFYGCNGFNGILTIPNSVTYISQWAFKNCSGFSEVHHNATNCVVYGARPPFEGCGGMLTIADNVETIPANIFNNAAFTGNLVIPNSVTTIGDAAFKGCSGFTGELTIPSSVTTIGYDAFHGCSGFTGSLTIPDTVTTIGSQAFYGCNGFTGSLTIGNSVTTIGESTFRNCGFTDSLTIGNSVTTIGNNAFNSCNGFTGSLTIPNSVITIGNYAFNGCTGFSGSLTIPNSVTTIGNNAFNGCTGFSDSLTIGNAVTTIGYGAFKNCTGFWGELVIPNSVLTIQGSEYGGAFQNCTGFSSLVLGVSLTTIGDAAFQNCTGFSGSLTIPNSVTTIGGSAFSGCNGFTGSLTIPNSVTTIGSYAFYYIYGFTGSLTIPNSVTTIGSAAFTGCRGFTGSLTLGNSVATIGDYAFQSCYGFSGSLTIPNSVTTIGEGAFGGCSGFSGSLTIPNSVTTLGGSAFSGCNGFTGSLTIPNSMTTIGGSTFYGCSGFSGSLTIPNSVTTIGSSVFSGCTGFSGSLTIPHSVTSIGDGAFYGCNGFTGVYYTGGINQWCNIWFSNEYSNPLLYAHNLYINNELVTDLVLPVSVTQIKQYAFLCATCLTSLTIGNNVNMIGNFAFYGCSGLTGILNIPNLVNSIGNYAFYGCSSFTGDLTIPNRVTSIGYYAFRGCSGFTGSLTLGSSLTTLGSYVFYGCNGFTEIYSNRAIPPTIYSGSYVFSNYSVPVYVPCGSEEAYQAATGWNSFTSIVGMCPGTVTVAANPTEGGMVTGGGYFQSGEQCTVTATAYEGFAFANWTKNGMIVTTNSSYSFYVAGDAVLVANFTPEGNIVFADANVKAICVEHWDTNGDGELSYAEAASVTDLGTYFQYNAEITSFDELQYFIGLSSIGDYAFYYCTGLASFVLPNTITTIGEGAFAECDALTSIVLPSSLMLIYEAFYGCENVQSIISLAVTPPDIGYYTFNGLYDKPLFVPCESLEAYQNAACWLYFTNILGMCGGTVTVEANPSEGGTVTGGGYYESGAQCTVTAIANEGFAFVNWTQNGAIVSTNAEYSFYVIGDATLVANFVSEGNIVFADSNVKAICVEHWDTNGDGELSYAEAASVTDLGTYFQYNDNITSFDELQYFIGLSSIGNSAFYYCTSLSTIVLPSSVTAIGNSAFYNCTGLTGELVIPETVTSIRNNAFSYCTGLTSFVLPNSLATIEYSAFYNCTGLTGEFVIPGAVTSIGNNAFYYCSNLQSIASLAVTPPSIEYNTFSGLYDKELLVPCDALEAYQSADYWSSFTSILGMCGGTVTVEASLTECGTVTGGGYYESGAQCTVMATANEGFAFANWTKNGVIVSTNASYTFHVAGDVVLVANFVPEGNIIFADANVKSICVSHWDTNGDGELSYAEAASVTDLGTYFQNNGNITSFDELQYFIGLSSIGDYVFYYCSGLTSIVLPSSLTTIGNNAFYYCSGLTGELVIPGAVTTIGNSAFYYCSNLQSIVSLAVTPPSIGSNSFSGLYGKPLFVLCDALEAYQNADYWSYFTNIQSMCPGTIVVEASPTVGGTVTGGGYYESGVQCTVTATANEGFTFVNWTQNGVIVSTNAEYTFYVMGDALLVANFIEGQFIYIGDGTATNQYLPSYNYYNYSLTQQIYTAEEIGSSGMITSIAFFNGGAEKTRTYDFYMKHTTKNNFSSNTDWIAVSPSDLVFSGSVTMVANDWTMIIFDTPFDYDGTSNVVLVADDNTGEYTSSPHMACRVFDADGYQAIYKYEDGTDYDPYNPSGYSGTRLSVKNQIILSMGSGSDYYVISATANPAEGGTVTGAGTYPEGSLCTLTAIPNDGYTFVNWTKDNVEVSTEAVYSFTVTEDAAYVANFVLDQGEVTQETSFSQGWNWWSTYVEQSGTDGLGMLEEGLGDNGITIRSQVGYTDYYAGYGWYGSLASVNNESSYKIKANAPCSVVLTGIAAVPSQHPITLEQGWTWMGYVSSTAMDVNEALAGLEATVGDKLKSQQGYADYYANYGWYGSLNTIEPGMGLMYYSTNSNPVTFTYPDGNRGGELKQNLTAENNHWKPNTYAYPDNMTVMALVELNDEELNTENYELAAFDANGECRGSVKLAYAEPLHRHVAFLTVSGKDAAELSFRLYNMETQEEYYDAEESLDFEANAIVGEADDLFVVHFRGTTSVDELAGSVKVYPNPVNVGEQFSIGMFGDVTDIVRVEIINTLGVVIETVCKPSRQTLTAPNVSGVYILKITVKGEGAVVHRLVVR